MSHTYAEHSSFVKFVERNWMIEGKLGDRSRDNLANPIQDDEDNAYVPRNMPAIGDLFDLSTSSIGTSPASRPVSGTTNRKLKHNC